MRLSHENDREVIRSVIVQISRGGWGRVKGNCGDLETAVERTLKSFSSEDKNTKERLESKRASKN